MKYGNDGFFKYIDGSIEKILKFVKHMDYLRNQLFYILKWTFDEFEEDWNSASFVANFFLLLLEITKIFQPNKVNGIPYILKVENWRIEDCYRYTKKCLMQEF